MPSLRRAVNDSHYYIRSAIGGRPMTYQLTPEGVQHLTDAWRLRDGDAFKSDLLGYLVENGWAYTNGGGLGEEYEGTGDRGTGQTSAVQTNPHGPGTSGDDLRGPGCRCCGTPIKIRLEGNDHTILDQSARVIVEAAERTGAFVQGPVPLPTRVERYTIVGRPSSRQVEIRTHKRLIDIGESSGQTIEALNRLSLPAGVDIKIMAVPTTS